MKKHKGWCETNGAVHAWTEHGAADAWADSGAPFDRFPKGGGIKVARYCENCGLMQTRTITKHARPDWEDEGA